LTINASGMIISAEVTIPIESFVLKHQGETVTSMTVDYSKEKTSRAKFQLFPVYLPSVAQVSGFTWRSDNEQVAMVSDKGVVTFLDCGFATITAESKDDKTVRSSCAFFVEDESVHDLTFYTYHGSEALQSVALKQFENVQLRVDVNPYNALDGSLTYKSSDESVFTCTSEGVLKGVGEGGSAALTVIALQKSGGTFEKTIQVTVEGACLVKCEHVYVCGDSIDVSSYIARGSAEGGNVVSLSSLQEGEEKTVWVKDGSQREPIVVHKLAGPTIGIRDMESWCKGEWKSGAYIAVGAERQVTPVDLATSETLTGVTLVSSNTSVLSVRDGRLLGIAEGVVTVTCSKAGYFSYETEIRVETPVSYFELNLDAKDDIVGLNMDRVFGTASYYDGVRVNGIKVHPTIIYPENSNEKNFSYYVDSEYATVDENGLILFKEGAEGREITVTVKSNFSTNSISRTYTFKKLVRGVNVGFGYGANVYDKENDVLPDFQPYYDAIAVTNGSLEDAIVFQTNVYMPPREQVEAIEGKNQKLGLFHDIHGNGYKMDGQLYQYHYESRLFQQADDDEYAKNPGATGARISNLYIQSYAPTSSESAAAFQELMTYGGTPIRTYFKYHPEYRVDFECCVFQYAFSHVIAIGGTIGFEGCIFRNSVGPGMLIESLHQQPTFVTVKNCIFSNMLSFAVLLSNGSLPPKGEIIKYNTLEWLGQNYIYNWKKTDEIRMDVIPEGVMDDDKLNKVLAGLNNLLTDSARMSFLKGRNSDLIVKQYGESYVNMGVMCMAFWADLNTLVNEPRKIGEDGRPYVEDGFAVTFDPRYASYLPVEMYTKNLGTILIEALKEAEIDVTRQCYMITNRGENGEYNTMPGDKYSMDESTYSKLRG